MRHIDGVIEANKAAARDHIRTLLGDLVTA